MPTPEIDPSIWKQMAEWAWGVVLLPIGVLWKKADGAASKSELKDSVSNIGEALKRHSEDVKETRMEFRDTTAEIFKKLDAVATTVTKLDTTISIRLDDLRHK